MTRVISLSRGISSLASKESAHGGRVGPAIWFLDEVPPGAVDLERGVAQRTMREDGRPGHDVGEVVVRPLTWSIVSCPGCRGRRLEAANCSSSRGRSGSSTSPALMIVKNFAEEVVASTSTAGLRSTLPGESRSELYAEFLTIINAGEVELPDLPGCWSSWRASSGVPAPGGTTRSTT